MRPDDLYRALVETTPEMMHCMDAQGRITYINPAQCGVLGYSREELIGKSAAVFLDESRVAALPRHLEILHREKRFFIPDSLWKRKDGTRLVCEVNAVADVDPEGNVRGAFVVARDVTRHIEVERALRESEDLQRTVLDQMQEAVVFADEHDIIRHINAFACDYLQTTRGEAVGQDLRGFHTPEVQPQIAEIIHTFKTDRSAQVVSRQRPLGDRELIFRFSAVRDAQGNYRGLIANLIDVTEIKRLETRLQQAQKAESVSRLARGIAHDFNNLMVTVTGLSSLLLRRLGENHPEVDKLREIEDAGLRASKLANQLLTYARTGRHRPQQTNLNDMVRGMLPLCRAGLPSTLTVETRLDPDLPDVYADVVQLEQVVMNLCRNAAEAMTSQGRVEIRTSVERLAPEFRGLHPQLIDVPLVCLTVTDDGCGMDPATLASAFDPYFSTKDSARGLGLPTVQGIVQSHGGHVHIESTPERGTAVKVLLPPYTE